MLTGEVCRVHVYKFETLINILIYVLQLNNGDAVYFNKDRGLILKSGNKLVYIREQGQVYHNLGVIVAHYF